MRESPEPVSPTPSRSEVNRHKVLASISRIAVLELLRSRAQPLGVVEIANHVGLHQNTVRSHLDLLVESGFATSRSEDPNGPGRPRVVYQATAAAEGEGSYRLLAEVLAQHLLATSERPGEAAVNAGRRWAEAAGRSEDSGSRISDEAAVVEVLRMLDESGFTPELSADGTAISLHSCPFREMAVLHPDVVCGAHLGIIQGALGEMGTMVKATGLLPFVTPGLCVTTLSRPSL